MKTRFTLCGLLSLIFAFTISHAQNPLKLGDKLLTADPSGHVWKDGKMYLYTSLDEECQKDFWMKEWRVFSSQNLQWADN